MHQGTDKCNGPCCLGADEGFGNSANPLIGQAPKALKSALARRLGSKCWASLINVEFGA